MCASTVELNGAESFMGIVMQISTLSSYTRRPGYGFENDKRWQ